MIKRRIQNNFIGLAVGLCALFSVLTFLMMYIIEDGVFERQLTVENREFRALGTEQRPSWQAKTRAISLHFSQQDLPPVFHRKKAYRNGIYEHFEPSAAYFLLSDTVEDTQERYFLLYDVTPLLSVRGARNQTAVVLSVITLLMILFAVLLAKRLVHRSLQPLKELADCLQQGVEELPSGFSKAFAGDEVGTLAQSLDRALQQLYASAEREFEFNRDVSHELRSPIQVAKSSLELLQLRAENDAKPVARLARAVEEMEAVSEAFLWLATENPDRLTIQHTEVSLLANKIAAEHRFRLAGKPIKLVVETKQDWKLDAPNAVFRVVFGNVLRNAINHTEVGEIKVVIHEQGLSIKDTGSGLPANINNVTDRHVSGQQSRGFGLGLAIVDRLCRRVGWIFELKNNQPQGVCAEIRQKADAENLHQTIKV